MSTANDLSTLSRRRLLTLAAGAFGASMMTETSQAEAASDTVMTVRGPLAASKMGFTLPHEHVLCDFIGAEKVSPDRYDPNEAFDVMLPFLHTAKDRGVKSFVDCTPMFIGRNPRLLRRLSEATGLHLLTNTGLYKDPFLPSYALKESAETLAARWTKEFKEGIEGTGIKPGFIKIAVNPGNLLDIQKKIMRAATLASTQTGLTVGCHTGHGGAALETLELLKAWKFPLDKYIVIHSDSISEPEAPEKIAKSGLWVSLDGIGGRPIRDHVEMIDRLLQAGHLSRLLLSHDAGWYNVGDPKGGKPRPYTALTDELIPALKAAGVTEKTIETLTVTNPQRAFSLGRHP